MTLLWIQTASSASKFSFCLLLEKHDLGGKTSHWSLTGQVVQSDAELAVCSRLVCLVYERRQASAGVRKTVPLSRLADLL